MRLLDRTSFAALWPTKPFFNRRQGGAVRDDTAGLGCGLQAGLSERAHRIMPGRPQTGFRVLRRGADTDQRRQQQDRGRPNRGQPRTEGDQRPATGGGNAPAGPEAEEPLSVRRSFLLGALAGFLAETTLLET